MDSVHVVLNKLNGSRQIGPRQIGPRQIGPLADLLENWAPHFLGPNILICGQLGPANWIPEFLSAANWAWQIYIGKYVEGCRVGECAFSRICTYIPEYVYSKICIFSRIHVYYIKTNKFVIHSGQPDSGLKH